METAKQNEGMMEAYAMMDQQWRGVMETGQAEHDDAIAAMSKEEARMANQIAEDDVYDEAKKESKKLGMSQNLPQSNSVSVEEGKSSESPG